tara:strand:+ start:530 stop:886 length:357 start_codon:yes stop_codon:yes gene_type:complete
MQVKTKVNPLKLRKTEFLSQHHTEDGRYVKRYFFSNGLGASVVCHKDSYGGHSGYFEVAVLKYRMGADEWNTSECIYDEPINEHLGIVDVAGWLDFCEVADILQKIRNYNTGEYSYDK